MRLNSARNTATPIQKARTVLLTAAAITLAAPAWAHPEPHHWETPEVQRVSIQVDANPEPSPEPLNVLDRVQEKALSLIGVRYRRGGSSPANGFDCSGFVQYVLREAAGLHLGRSAASQATEGQPVERDNLRLGDLVFFHTFGRGISHVGLYLGHGEFIHAPSSGKHVRVENIDDPYWRGHYAKAARLKNTDAGETNSAVAKTILKPVDSGSSLQK